MDTWNHNVKWYWFKINLNCFTLFTDGISTALFIYKAYTGILYLKTVIFPKKIDFEHAYEEEEG